MCRFIKDVFESRHSVSKYSATWNIKQVFNNLKTLHPPESFTLIALGGEYKAEQNRCRKLGVLPKFHSKAFLKINEYPSADDFEGKKRLHGV